MRNPYARTLDVVNGFEDMVHQNPTSLSDSNDSGVKEF